MLWLPAPNRAATSPMAVSDASAAALERALLETNPTAAVVSVRGALLTDPWLCQWTVAWPGADATSIDDLAQWFVADSLRQLATLDEAPPAWSRPTETEQATFADQAAGMLVRAVRRTGVGVDAASSTNFLAALLEPGELPTEVAVANEYLAVHLGVEWRLPRLAQKLANCVSRADFARRLEHAKLDAMKELAYGASHEVNNPLANISGRAQAMLREETDPKKRRLLAAMDAQAMRAHEMISDLMLFARPPALVKQLTDLSPLIEELLEELRSESEARQIRLEWSPPPSPVSASIDPTQVAVAIKALLQNGIDAVGNDGAVTVDVTSEADSVVVRVTDTGPGIADEVREHLFDPFYSGREAGRGLGFGLSKCWRIATEHAGSVEVVETSTAGTTIALSLPLERGEQ